MDLPEELSTDFFDLANSIASTDDTLYDRALAVDKYLKANYEYTLSTPQHAGSPIESFLFTNKRGHCEYFATAAVLLMRALGVPARLVSGFRGGTWNDFGKYATVRQRKCPYLGGGTISRGRLAAL